jgi:hypothetical protein
LFLLLAQVVPLGPSASPIPFVVLASPHAPEAIHYGRAQTIFQKRARTLDVALLANPNRFTGKIPQPPRLQTGAWINPLE